MTVRATSIGRETRGPAVIDDIAIDAGRRPAVPGLPGRRRSDAAGPGRPSWPGTGSTRRPTTATARSSSTRRSSWPASGVTTLLPQGRFPWSTPPTGAAADIAAIEAEVARLHAGVDAPAGAARRSMRSRLALVGHDFGGMLAAVAAPDVAGPAGARAHRRHAALGRLVPAVLADPRRPHRLPARAPAARPDRAHRGRRRRAASCSSSAGATSSSPPMTGLEFRARRRTAPSCCPTTTSTRCATRRSAPTASRSCGGPLRARPSSAPAHRAGRRIGRVEDGPQAAVLVRLDGQDAGPRRACRWRRSGVVRAGSR